MDIAKNIRDIRREKSIKQQALADALHLDVAVVSNIENGKRELKVSELEAISNALNISIIDLISYPNKYVLASTKIETDEPVDAVLQIKLSKEKKDQVFQPIFGDNCLEILNK